MAEEKDVQTPEESEGSLAYIVGAIVVIAVIVAGILLWPKTKKETTTPQATEQTVETKPMFSKLTCEKQWYNPVIGYPKYYLSADGGDVDPAKTVECSFSVIQGEKTVLTEKVPVTVKASPERGGNTFQCTTKALEGIPSNVPLKLVTTVTDDIGKTASCTGTVTFK